MTHSKKQLKKPFLKRKRSLLFFILISLIGGAFFIDKGSVNKMTGNVVLTKYYSFSIISLIGLSLILCSSILICYYIYKYK